MTTQLNRHDAGARRQAYTAAGAAARDFDLTDDAPIVAAFTAALTAMRELWTATAARADQLAAVCAQADQVGALAREFDERGDLAAAGLPGAASGHAALHGPRTVTIDGPAGRRTAVNVHPAIVCGYVLTRALVDERERLRREADAAGRPFYGVDWPPELEIEAATVAAPAEFPALADTARQVTR
jgi:hypothetical protein